MHAIYSTDYGSALDSIAQILLSGLRQCCELCVPDHVRLHPLQGHHRHHGLRQPSSKHRLNKQEYIRGE